MDVVAAKAASKGLEIVYWNKDGDEINDWILGDSTRFRQIVINCMSLLPNIPNLSLAQF
jgi:hypothetical protein